MSTIWLPPAPRQVPPLPVDVGAIQAFAADLRTRMNAYPEVDPMNLFEHVYAEPTPQLREQREMVRAEIAGAAHAAHGSATHEEATR